MSSAFKIGNRLVQPDLNCIVCNGDTKRIEPKMMEVLLRLAENPGEVISKEELIGKVWAGTFVTDDVLTRCISELRKRLDDDPKSPSAIQTIPKKGYRLTVEVKRAEKDPQSGPGQLATERLNRSSRHLRRWLLFGAAVGGIAAALTLGVRLAGHRRVPPASRVSIVIAEFTNKTVDPVFDGTLRQGLAAEMEQSPFFEIVSDEQISRTLRLMGQEPSVRLQPGLAREVCQRTGSAAELDGLIAQIGVEYELALSAFDCSTGKQIGTAQAVATDRNKILDALGRVSISMRSKLGETLASRQRFARPLEEVTTPSLEALQAYTRGWQADLQGDQSAAIPSFQAAVSRDPQFAMAYAALGTSYWGLGETTLATENSKRAYELRDRVSERERFYISSHYEENVTGNLEKAIQLYSLWLEAYPADVVPAGHISFDESALGHPEKSLEAARHALELAPDRALPYECLAISYLDLNRLDEAAEILQQAKARGIESPAFQSAAYSLAFLRGGAAGLESGSNSAAGELEADDWAIDFRADTAAYGGQLAKANNLTAQAVAAALHSGKKESAAVYEAGAALREAFFGNTREAEQKAGAALRISSGSDAEFPAAMALAVAGDTSRASALAHDLNVRFTEDTVVQFELLPALRAQLALRSHGATEAIALLQPAAPYELGNSGPSSLLAVLIRGDAYLAARQGIEATAEFRKILDHPGLVLNQVTGPLALLGLARARALSGDKSGAQKAYQDFLSKWENADTDVPILRESKSEYAKLY